MATIIVLIVVFNEIGAVYFPVKSYIIIIVELKNLLSNAKKFHQRTKCYIQQQKRVIQSENLFSDAKLYYLTRKLVIQSEKFYPTRKRVIYHENVLFSLKTCF